MRQFPYAQMSQIMQNSLRPLFCGKPIYCRFSTHSSGNKRTLQSRGARCQGRHLTIVSSIASETKENSYRSPPGAICDIVEASPEPVYAFSPCRELVLQLSRPIPHPSVSELARSELKLAGLRIDPQGFCRSRRSHYTGLKVAKATDDLKLPFNESEGWSISGVPDGYGIYDVSWSPNGSYVVFTIRPLTETETSSSPAQLWAANALDGQACRVLHRGINSVFHSYSWVNDTTLIAAVVPEEGMETPAKPTIPIGPRIEDNSEGRESQVRTYQDLLRNSHDVAQFEHYCRSQLMTIELTTGNCSDFLNEPRIYTLISPSPGGQYVLVSWLQPPWSYAVPCGRFPRSTRLFTRSGEEVRVMADLPLAESIPLGMDACREGPRGITWRDDKPAELSWAECQDNGNPEKEVSIRDLIYTLDLSLDGATSDPKLLASTEMRYAGITWGHDGLALLYERDWKKRRTRTWVISPNQIKPAKLLLDRNLEDSYSDPGVPLMRRTEMGTSVLVEIDKHAQLLFYGFGASDGGYRPFLDLWDIEGGEKQRIWQCQEEYFETISSIMSDPGSEPFNLQDIRLLARRESKDLSPQYYMVDFKEKENQTWKTQWRQISDFAHPYPSLKAMRKEILRYKREDGVDLSGTLYLPPGYDKDKDGKLPCIIWAYPREFKSKDAAGQFRDSFHRFDILGSTSPLLFLTQGFAVFDGPTMPIIGEKDEEPNDTFIEQLTSSARAAVEELGRHGCVDVQRLAIGGHSYGAFMAAALMAHEPTLFSCGIARSGAYNRTLTPFGFQSEDRTFWKVPSVYHKMSPFMSADRIQRPLLLIHGESDNNPGTLVLQSERLYAAMKGHGTPCRLVVLPLEGHSYIARESILHCLAETNDWLNKYCKI